MSVRWRCASRKEFLECCRVAGMDYDPDDLWLVFEPLSVDDRCRALDMAADSMFFTNQSRVLIECLEAGVPFSYVFDLLPSFGTSGPIRQLYKSKVPPEYFIAVEKASFERMVSTPMEFIMGTYSAGVPVEYAVVCAGRFSADDTASMWREGIPLDYVEALP